MVGYTLSNYVWSDDQLWKISWTLVVGQYDDSEDGEEDDYVYQEPDPDQLRNRTFRGNRLIGARTGDMRTEVPFIVLINNGEDFLQ